MGRHFIDWTGSISYYEEEKVEALLEFTNSMDEKVDRTNYYLGEVSKKIGKLMELESKKINGNNSEKDYELLYSYRTIVNADSITAIQNIHFLGDILGKALNVSLSLDYNSGDRFYLGSLRKKLKRKKKEVYGELIEKLEALTSSKEWKLILFISNREKHQSCFDFGIHNNKYSLITTSKNAQRTTLNRNEVKSFLVEYELFESETQLNDIVTELEKLKYLPTPDGILELKEKVIDKIDKIGEAAYNIIEKKHQNN